MNILVPNLGSTSLKYQILEMPAERVLARGRFERVTDYREAIARIPTADPAVDAVAFKTVLGGPRYRGTFLIDATLIAAMEEYLPAAPAHNAIYLAAIRAFSEAMPGIPLVAAFETEFHSTIPEYAARYGVPAEWRERYGIRRYGFHGASHQYVSERVPELLGRPRETLRLVSCHLGGSSSICAIQNGRSVDTTMGFSPQSGLENATRHGELDVFAVLYMMERRGWSVAEVRQQLAREGGLAGLSGIAGGDVRDLEAAADQGNQDAALALEVFAYQVRKTIGAYAAAMGGLDAVAFTGGIGENSARLRSRCCQGLEFLGIRLDPVRNERGAGDRVVSSDDSPVAVVALATNEELIVARRAYKLLAATSRSGVG
ncbi:MAG: acetate/propionate family kinase [Bryobacterales bacterium]|nr:acetate/propionate family kinase [Bryobacteraceae bacterium]MDW8129242.1 acetate/propionate family kinase [Bryobacterales bacterium]